MRSNIKKRATLIPLNIGGYKMKSIRYLVIIFIIVAILLPSIISAAPPLNQTVNLIQNGNFETGNLSLYAL